MHASSTVDDDEAARSSASAAQWWDPDGKIAVLHKLCEIVPGLVASYRLSLTSALGFF